MSLLAVSLCLILELVMLICAFELQKPGDYQDGIGVLYRGDCSKAQRISILLAIPLNIIATLLLSTSNYVMQCLAAPTRKELDKAHASGRYLNIGVSSVYNVVYNYSRKSLLWLVLVITTVPIHLLLNSAFFNSLQANNYGVMVVSQGWLEDDSWSNCQAPFGFDGEGTLGSQFACEMRHLAAFRAFADPNLPVPLPLQRLTKADCYARYSYQFQRDASNVILVSNTTTSKYAMMPMSMGYGTNLSVIKTTGNAVPVLDSRQNWKFPRVPQNTSGAIFLQKNDSIWEVPTFLSAFSSFDYRYWMMAGQVDYNFNDSRISSALRFIPESWTCDPSVIMSGAYCATNASNEHKTPTQWLVTPEHFVIDHCLSQPTSEQCTLEYSFTILLIVVACDVLKLIAMAIALWWLPERPLATIGDAIASFLERPDPFTLGKCLLDQTGARRRVTALSGERGSSPYLHVGSTHDSVLHQTGCPKHHPVEWTHRVSRWYSVPSKLRWISFVLL
jgi:hypothetical protein